MRITSYRDLTVWQRAVDLAEAVYALTSKLPKSELYCLTSQMRRSTVSIASNIAEGKARGTRKDYRRFLLHAYGSGAELETQIEIAKRLRLCEITDFKTADMLTTEVMRMLNVLISKLGCSQTQLPTPNSPTTNILKPNP